jgi:hypothetical protein
MSVGWAEGRASGVQMPRKMAANPVKNGGKGPRT